MEERLFKKIISSSRQNCEGTAPLLGYRKLEARGFASNRGQSSKFFPLQFAGQGCSQKILVGRGRGNMIILICNSRKIQSMTYIHIYICLLALVLEKKNIKSNQN